MSEDYIVRNCAPTLAGLKTGSMFTCPCASRGKMIDSIRKLNKRLNPKGLRILPLRFSDRNALIYLYRPAQLKSDLSNSTASLLLLQRGYDPENCGKCLVHLVKKLRTQQVFPHEIGLFLGYPPEDVSGFIENQACGCKCIGCWKVYGDEAAARKRFAQYKKCSRVYWDQWAKGKDIERLAVKNRRNQ